MRDVDLASPIATAPNQQLAGRELGFVFQSEAGGALHQSNLLRRSLHPILEKLELEKRGFHAFRRFRVTQLRQQRVPEDLLTFWIGHAPRTVTDGYSMLKEDREYGQMVAEKAGLGFKFEADLHELHENGVLVAC